MLIDTCQNQPGPYNLLQPPPDVARREASPGAPAWGAAGADAEAGCRAGGGGPAAAATARIMRWIHSYLVLTFSARSTKLVWSFTMGLHSMAGRPTTRAAHVDASVTGDC